MVETLTLWSPHKLLKILAHSPNTLNAVKVRQKKLKFFLSILDTMENGIKKPAYATVPLSCDGLTGLLAGGGEGEAAAEEEDDAPAHLRLNEPPGDEARAVLIQAHPAYHR